jgi:hypothetical protein
LLTALQHVDLAYHPGEFCRNADPQWLTFRGANYVAFGSPSPLAPKDVFDEHFTVATIRQGKPVDVCSAVYHHDVPPALTGVWSGSTWAHPPADMPTPPVVDLTGGAQ